MTPQEPADQEESGVVALLNTLRELENAGRVDEALSISRQWLSAHPNTRLSVAIWYEFGRLMQKQGSHVQAENAFRAALEKKFDFHEARIALGLALEAQGKTDEAVNTWVSAIPPVAAQIELLNNAGRLLDQAHRPEEAERVLQQSLTLDSTQEPVLTTLLQLRQKLCHWPVLTPALGVDVARQQACIGPLMSLALFDDPVTNLASARRFLASRALDTAGATLTQRGAVYAHHARLRVGFLSADFRLHATSIFFAPLIEQLDRTHFEIYLLDLTTAADPFGSMRAHLLQSADHHVPLQSLSDDAAAAQIAALEIDVLIDMAGLTAGARPAIVAARPAPVQLAYLGFLASCGIPAVDYVVTTRDLFTQACCEGFTEAPLYLPDRYLTLPAATPLARTLTRADCGLPDDAMVYCALLNSYKITPEMFACWMRILRAVPDSVLWLVEENKTLRANLEAEARQHGISAERLHFSPRVMPDEYRARLSLADLFLDSSPYGNGATTHDVILARLPILTKPGNTMMSRLAAHVMSALGLNELIVPDLAHYEALAIDCGRDRDRLARYRETLTAAMATSTLFDREKFVRDFGALIRDAVAATPVS